MKTKMIQAARRFEFSKKAKVSYATVEKPVPHFVEVSGQEFQLVQPAEIHHTSVPSISPKHLIDVNSQEN